MKKLIAWACTLCILLGCMVVPVGAAESNILTIPWDKISSVGKQPTGSDACGCYALAYARTILDNKVHYWYEYDANGGNNVYDACAYWTPASYTPDYSSSSADVYKQAYQSIKNGRPFIVRVAGSRSDWHYITIVGYTDVSDISSLSAKNFLIIDAVQGTPTSYAENMASAGYELKSSSNGMFQYCYTNSGSPVPPLDTGISLSGQTAPTKLDVGQVFILKGTISSGATLTNVTVGVFDKESGGTMKTGRSVSPNTKTYNIANVDAYVEFNKLSAGTYYYRITATNSGGTKVLLNQKFTVGTDYSISISGANTPSYFNVGNGMTIQGMVSSGATLTNVTVGCYDYNGTMQTGKSVNPNSGSFNINSIDADVRFSSLAPGVYTYRITATNSGGTKTLVEKVFTVLSDKATVQDGIYSILSNSKTCAVSAVSKDSGSNIELATVDSYDTMQQFKVRYAGSGYYTLQNLASGKWLSVVDNSWEACTNVILRKGDSAKGQLWQIIPSGDGYCLVPQCATICCLDVHDGAIGRPGENVWIYTANCTAAQQFQMVLRRVYVSFDANGGAVGNAFMTGKADEIDVDRGQYKTVIYTTGGQTIATNKFGTEAAVNANGLVTAIRDYGTDTLLTVPDGGFVISSHSTSATNPTGGFVESLKVGDYVDFQPYYMELKAYKSQSDYLVHHKNAIIGDSYGPLPDATRNGYIFDGWYTESTGGTQITASTKVTVSSNHTLYAHWTKQEQPVVPPVTPTAEIHFPKVSTYTQGQFTDVPAAQWFTKNVAAAVEFGLMKGNSATTFNPYGDVTLAEAITMAARIHSIYTTGTESFIQDAGGKWYQVYLDYAYQNGIISQTYYTCDVTQKATRAQYAEIFANALPGAGLEARNTVADNAIPDVSTSVSYAPSVYKLYRAGILAGGDVNGTFSPLTYITRAESATVVSRMADSDNRVNFTLS